MTNSHSDALVFFGATGDLAYKKIFPALQAMVKRGHLNVPVIGVAKAGWNLDQLRARAKDSLEKHGGLEPAAFNKLMDLLGYVDGDYQDPATFTALRNELKGAQSPAHYLAIPPVLFETVVQHLAESDCSKGGRVIVEKPFGHDLASATTWASARSTTCWRSVSPTLLSSLFGTALISRVWRSPWPRTSASKVEAVSTIRPEPSATLFRTIYFRCYAIWQWNRPSALTATQFATRK